MIVVNAVFGKVLDKGSLYNSKYYFYRENGNKK
jgi:hypothetical protein